METEKHHAREEEALFPVLEERGITGPTRIMRLEHNEMRPKKKHLLEIAKRAAEGSIPYDEFVKDLRATASFINESCCRAELSPHSPQAALGGRASSERR